MKKIKNSATIIIILNIIFVFAYALTNIDCKMMPAILFDEFGYWSNGSLIAGYNWNGVTSALCPYYSYGYSLLLGGMLCLFRNANLAYQCAILANAFFVSVIIIIYNFLLRRLSNVSYSLIAFIGIVITTYPGIMAYLNLAWSEIFLSMVYAISLLLIYLYIYSEKTIYCFGAIFTLMYLYSIHQRSIFATLFGLCFILILGFKRKRFFDIALGSVICLSMFGGLLLIKKNFYDLLWNNDTGNLLQIVSKELSDKINIISDVTNVNDYLGQIDKLTYFFSQEGLSSFIFLFIGKIFYIGIATFGIAYEGILFIYQEIRKMLNEKKEFSAFYCVLIINNLFFACLLTTIFLITTKRIDVVVYSRYVDWTLIPIICVGMLKIFCDGVDKLRFALYMCFQLGYGMIFYKYTLKNNLYSFYEVCAPFWYKFYQSSDTRWILSVLLMVVIIECIIVLVIKSKNSKFKCIAYCLIAVTYLYLDDGVNDRIEELRNEKEIIEVIDTIKSNETNELYFLYDLKRDDGKDGYGMSNYYIGSIQFNLLDSEIKCISYTRISEINNGIIIAPNYDITDELINYGFDNIFQTKNYRIFISSNVRQKELEKVP